MRIRLNQIAAVGIAITLAFSSLTVSPVHTQAATKKVTAKQAGTATITVVSKSNNKVKTSCKITVKKKSNTSGTYKKTKWSVDKNGLLKVTGTGDMYDAENGNDPPWYECRKKIKSAKIEVKGATSLYALFEECENLENVDLSKLDTSKVKELSLMFFGCSSLKSVKWGKFKTSKVLDMSLMFYNCKSLKKLDLSKFNTSKVTDMHSMFYGCSSLKSVDVSKFDTSKVTDMSYMFSECNSLTTLDLSSFDTSAALEMKMVGWSNTRGEIVHGVWDDMFKNSNHLEIIHTPKKSDQMRTSVLPVIDNCMWTDENGGVYSCLPRNAKESIILTCKSKTTSVTPPTKEGDILFSGAFGTTTWSIDKNGLLEVKGTGDMYYREELPQWYPHRAKIKSAKIEVNRATTLVCMFRDCNNLQNVDLSNLDTSKVTDMREMFSGCSSLTVLDISEFDTSKVTDMKNMLLGCDSLITICTPKCSGTEVAMLPGNGMWIWVDADKVSYKSLPKNAKKSIQLTKEMEQDKNKG